MMPAVRNFLPALVFLVASAALAGSPTRYALVIGNNAAATPAGVDLKPLQHAEREASRLARHLVDHGKFAAERVILVTGGTREDVLAAAARLADLHAEDRAEVGDLPSLFAFFFTGHGLAGQLLTADAPVTGSDLAGMFQRMGATFTFGFFDACHSGSLDHDALSAKGLKATAGFNPVAELPEEVIAAEGTMWLVSSKPDEVSYEDRELGGLFTHFFIEAFTQARPDGPGVTLDGMWEYARRQTLSHASRYGRTQTPEKLVRRLKTSGPVYMSFPRARTATLAFAPDVEGTFLLRAADGALVEKVLKPKGQPLEVPVFAGALTVSEPAGQGAMPTPVWSVELEPGERLTVQPRTADQGPPPPGYDDLPISAKGGRTEVLTRRREQQSFTLSAGYRFDGPANDFAAVTHLGVARLTWLRGPLAVGFEGGFGGGSADFESWSYAASATRLAVDVGYGFAWGSSRLEAIAGGGLDLLSVTYGDDAVRALTTPFLVAGGRLWTDLMGLRWALSAELAAQQTEAIAADATETLWRVGPRASLTAGYAF